MNDAYYNEIDPYAAQWLRNLIAAGHLPDGEVDERDIREVQPDDVRTFAQAHFFAGIGGWGLATRLSGWPDARPIWTGSCPCQPFSVAGKGAGASDERHLWPDFFRLIAAVRPPVVMGEQVAAAVGKSWLDGVSADLEGIGYACGAALVPACAVDAPHRRDRLWFVADADQPREVEGRATAEPSGASGPGALVHAEGVGRGEGRTESELRGGRSAAACASPWGASGRITGADGKARRVGSNLRGVVDGLSESLAGLCSEFYAEAEEEVNIHAAAAECGPREILRAVRDEIASQAIWQKPRGFYGISEAEILFPYLCELDRRIYQSGVSSTVAQASRTSVRGVRLHAQSSRSSQGRGYDEQCPGEHSDALHLLSQLLARAARQAFEVVSSDAGSIQLLGRGIEARVGKLRALGNAIVPALAAEVIGAFMEVRP